MAKDTLNLLNTKQCVSLCVYDTRVVGGCLLNKVTVKKLFYRKVDCESSLVVSSSTDPTPELVV